MIIDELKKARWMTLTGNIATRRLTPALVDYINGSIDGYDIAIDIFSKTSDYELLKKMASEYQTLTEDMERLNISDNYYKGLANALNNACEIVARKLTLTTEKDE